MKSLPKNCTNKWLKNSKEGQSLPGLKIMFGLLKLAEMGSLSSRTWGVKYLLCVIAPFQPVFIESKDIPLKNKKAKINCSWFYWNSTQIDIDGDFFCFVWRNWIYSSSS